MILTGRRPHLSVALLLLALTRAAAVPAHDGFPENYEIRAKYRELIFGPSNGLLEFDPTIEEQAGQVSTVSMRVQRQNDAFYVLVTNEIAGAYPIHSSGSYVIKRDMNTGDLVQIKIFLSGEPGTFARISPLGGRARMDVFLMDRPVFQNVVLPIPLEQLVVEPISTIVQASNRYVDWRLLFPPVQRPTDLTALSMVSTLRALLGSLRDSDDGAMDATGTYRFIEDLTENLQSGFNCSGFAKWVVDGLYLPRTGGMLPIELLKEKHVDRRGNDWSERYEDDRDPFFGLDWTRNLAAAIGSLNAQSRVDTEAADVRHVPFAQYVEDVGYRVEDLELVLYLLARLEPGHFYVGSVNREYGDAPVLRQHMHVVVLFPYFDAAGRFQAAVMERNLETGIASLRGRYAGDYIHLVRIPVSESYLLPSVSAVSDGRAWR
jgi:hypothetical protein